VRTVHLLHKRANLGRHGFVKLADFVGCLSHGRLLGTYFALGLEYNRYCATAPWRLPLFVKPLRHDASIGISTQSLVGNTKDLLERIVDIQQKCKDAALVEEYINGREFYVGILGNRNPTVFPPLELDFSGLPEGAPRVLDAKAK
jgi:hypothetical protein